jgi:Protein of unknown function (DUF760)
VGISQTDRVKPVSQPSNPNQISHNDCKEVQLQSPFNQSQEFLGDETNTPNLLWDYVQSLSPDAVSQLSKPTSQDVFQVMERNIVGLLGNLPPEHFGVSITTSRENLGRLLASAMISGYFLRNVEQRMVFENVLAQTPGPTNDRD